MIIELLYTRDCPHFRKARRLIHDTIKSLGLDIPLKKTEVRNEEEAQQLVFPGSPTIRIDGEDIEPDTAYPGGNSCRTYFNGTHLPDKDVVKCAIAHAAGLKTILFVCTGNAVRSQIAEAVVNHFLGDAWVAFSAGIIPMEVNPSVVKVMQEIGIDISQQKSKHVDVFRNCHFDRVISLCHDADAICLTFPTTQERDRIIFHDPASTYGLAFGSLHLYRNLRDEIRKILLKRLGDR
ncbi:MAG: DF family (seleno)protein [Nitrospirota bacterium]